VVRSIRRAISSLPKSSPDFLLSVSAKGPTFQVFAARREYLPAGECIYCHRTPPTVKLTEEHIIPEGLGGRMVLPEASCDDCSDETHAFEGHVSGRMIGDVRRHFGVRGKKRKRPRHPTAYVEREGETHAVQVPLEAHPAVLAMPVFGPPGILFDFPKTDELQTELKVINFIGDLNERILALGGTVQTRPFSIEPFGRMLCKIAHAFAYAEARGEFDAYLEGKIRGERPLHLSHYVGCSIIDEPDGNSTNTLHQIGLSFHNRYVVIRIRLFAIVDGPVYWVVVGRIKGT
jgi:hypothetical protein